MAIPVQMRCRDTGLTGREQAGKGKRQLAGLRRKEQAGKGASGKSGTSFSEPERAPAGLIT